MCPQKLEKQGFPFPPGAHLVNSASTVTVTSALSLVPHLCLGTHHRCSELLQELATCWLTKCGPVI